MESSRPLLQSNQQLPSISDSLRRVAGDGCSTLSKEQQAQVLCRASAQCHSATSPTLGPPFDKGIVIPSARLLSNSLPSPQQVAYVPSLPDSSSIALHKSLEECHTSPDAFPDQRPPYHSTAQHCLNHSPQYDSNVGWRPPGSNQSHALQLGKHYAPSTGRNEPNSTTIVNSRLTPSCYNSRTEIPATNTSKPYHAFPRVSPIPPLNYDIAIRQQPAAARACGLSQHDRRVIDPPPILELKITDKATRSPGSDSSSILAMYCTLLDSSNQEVEMKDQPMIANIQSTSSLMGTLVASPYDAEDERGVAGTFFIFSDLSCRTPGRYRLFFKLLRIDVYNMQQGATHGIVASIATDVFSVYTAKDFPGMRASSELLRAFHRQGFKTRLKKGPEACRSRNETRNANSPDGHGSDALEDKRVPGGRAEICAPNG